MEAEMAGAGGIRGPWPALFARVVLGAAMIAAFGPLLVQYVGWHWSRPHYQHFPLIILACLSLLAFRWFDADPQARRVPCSIWLLLCSWIVLLLAVALFSPMVAAIAAILLFGALCAEIACRKRVTYLWGIWALSWLVIPLPLGIDRQLITFLQGISSRLSSRMIDAVGVLHLAEGNVLLLPGKQLFVDEACSGIVSVFTIVACAAVWGVSWNRSPVHVLLLASTGVVWATLLNVIRIGVIAIIYARFGLDWSVGASHEMLGMTLFLFALAAIVVTDQLLVAALTPMCPAWEQSTGYPLIYGRRLAVGWDWLVMAGRPDRIANGLVSCSEPTTDLERPDRARIWLSGARTWWVAGVGFFGLALAQCWTWLHAANTNTVAVASQAEFARSIDKSTLPAAIAGAVLQEHHLEQRPSKHQFGEYSAVFEYRKKAGSAFTVAFDFAFPHWHELTLCYRSIGWKPTSRQVHEVSQDATDAWKYVEAEFRKPDGQAAVVLFCEFSETGTPLGPTGSSFSAEVANLVSRMHPDRCFQVQVVMNFPGDVSQHQVRDAREVLCVARDHFRRAVIRHGRSRRRASSGGNGIRAGTRSRSANGTYRYW